LQPLSPVYNNIIVSMGGLASVDPSGASILLPEGEYQSCFNVFRSLGNPTNPNHVVVAETPRVVISR